MSQYRYAGYRIVEFPEESRVALKEICRLLSPHENEIIDAWVGLQFSSWQPPGVSRDEVKELFGGLFHGMLASMATGQLEKGVEYLEEAGADLAKRNFPYEALVISLHFLEESYMPFLLEAQSPNTREWLIRMDEFLHVAFAAIATSYFEYQRDALLQEVEVGRIIQAALMPKLPKRVLDLEIGYVYASASERARLGGDLLDLFMLDENKAAFIVGDLSGHGLDAAASAVMVRSLFKGFMIESANLTEAMTRLNHVLMVELGMEQFATALACTYEPSGRLMLVNAGHPSPLICGGRCEIPAAGGPPLAIFPRPAYALSELEIEPGSTFIAYTDGLSEARTGMDLFGEERIKEAALEVRGAPARAVAEHLLDRAVRHAEGHIQDDIAILVLKRRGNAMG